MKVKKIHQYSFKPTPILELWDALMWLDRLPFLDANPGRSHSHTERALRRLSALEDYREMGEYTYVFDDFDAAKLNMMDLFVALRALDANLPKPRYTPITEYSYE